MNEPMLGQTSRSAVESYLRAKREKGQLTDEEIARLDAIGFKWEKRKKKTIEEKVDLYVHYRESGKRWRCNETAEVAERPTRAIREQRSRCAWAVCARSEEEKAVRRWFVSKRERYMKPSEMLEYKSGNIHPRYPTP